MSLCSFFYAYSVNLHNIPYLCPYLKEQHMKKVDKLDLKILQIISLDARVPFKDVAEICGVSRAAIHQRVSRLCEAGVITGSGYQRQTHWLQHLHLCGHHARTRFDVQGSGSRTGEDS